MVNDGRLAQPEMTKHQQLSTFDDFSHLKYKIHSLTLMLLFYLYVNSEKYAAGF